MTNEIIRELKRDGHNAIITEEHSINDVLRWLIKEVGDKSELQTLLELVSE